VTGDEVVACEQVVAAPPTEVFRWFVDPDRLASWIGIRATLFLPRLAAVVAGQEPIPYPS
jgi:uncharacterized protein YndB with AHSA1/START domain